MKTLAILSWGYWFSVWSVGLLIHPYATLRKIIREHFLRPLVLLPLVTTILLWIMTVLVVHGGAIILRVLDIGLPTAGKFGLSFMFWWVVWFLGLWQAVLGYLFVRFWKVLR